MTGISSEPITLTHGIEPMSELGQGTYIGTLDDNDVNMTVDFGFFELLTLGNTIWIDDDDDGQIGGTESGASAGVVVNLLDGSGNPVLHPITGLPITATTNSSGEYMFFFLYPDESIVEVDPVNFQSGGLLEGYVSSTGSVDPDDDESDIDDNGVDGGDPPVDGIRTLPVTLAYESFIVSSPKSGPLGTNVWVISPYKGQAGTHSYGSRSFLCDMELFIKTPRYYCSLSG